MRVVPENAEAKVRFFEQHLAVWTANADAVGLGEGLNAAHLEVLVADVAEARAAVDAQRLAQQAARSATIRARNAVATLARSGAVTVGVLRAQSVDGIESLTHLPAPRRRRKSIGPPGTPERFDATLDALGRIALTWRCEQPSRSGGVLYHVQRRLDGEPWRYIGTVGKRRFVDDTLPAGTASATYRVQAARVGRRGPLAEFRVSLGVHPGTAALTATSPRTAEHASKMTATGPFVSVAAA